MFVEGRIREINNENIISQSFKTRDVIITTEEQYPQHLSIQFTQDKCDLLNMFNKGDRVKISINLRGREWVNPQGESKYFNTIQGWRIEKIQPEFAPQNNHSAVDAYEAKHNPPTPSFNEDDDHDDLPF